MRRRPPPASTPAAGYPAPSPAEPSSPVYAEPEFENDEGVEDYLRRNAPLAARTIVRESLHDRKAAQWLLEQTTKDRLSAPIDVTPEHLSTADGVADVMRLLGARALRGEAGLGESLKACQVVREVSDAMFAKEISSLREAVDKAKSGRLAPVIAHQIEEATGGVVPVAEYEAIANSVPPVVPAWGRFGKALVEDAEQT